MFKFYIKGVAKLALRSSWSAINGVVGAVIAGAVMIWSGVLPIIHGNEPIQQATNWALTFVIYTVMAWLLIFIFRLIFLDQFYFWKKERERAIELETTLLNRGAKQQLLDEIAALRTKIVRFRIDTDRDYRKNRLDEKGRKTEFDGIQDEIALKIEQFSSKAEAEAYRNRGNINRPISPMGGFVNHPLVDICVHDLDYLQQFILDYSRYRERQT